MGSSRRFRNEETVNFTKEQLTRSVKLDFLICESGLSVAETVEFVFVRLENIMRKGENAGNQHFFSFPSMFLNLSQRSFETWDFMKEG